MDEREWATATDPQEMFRRVQDRASTRQLRCFAFACGRRYCVIHEEAARVSDYYRELKPAVDAQCRRIIDAAEQCDDGQGTARKAQALRQELKEQPGVPIGLWWDITSTLTGNVAYWFRRFEDTAGSASEQASQDAGEVWRGYAGRVFQADLLRCIFGNPFRPAPTVAEDALAWNDAAAVKLANRIYQERDFSRESLGVLADALEEAGATDAELLGHLRGPGPHVRGCYAVDQLLRTGGDRPWGPVEPTTPPV